MTLKSFENLYLVCPLSLGDQFVINAIVHHFADRAHSLWLPVVPQFWETVKCLYQDWPNIHLVPYLGAEREAHLVREKGLAVVNFRTVFELSKLPLAGSDSSIEIPVMWDRQIYEHFDWCYNVRYQQFRWPSHVAGAERLYHALNPSGQPYVLWHKHTSRHVGGLDIDLASWRPAAGLPNLPIVEVELGHSPNLLDYQLLIERAAEIHVVPSSFHCLVDSILDKTAATLFFHDARRDTLLQPNSRWNAWRWHVVDYGALRQ